jgi:crotonobetainyl-CoA:carnitine CoA-transferase CaiB-like acyl-CoA transferase
MGVERHEQIHMSGPLAGKRVLDLTRVLAGPWATQLLADMGAEVIKIERPGEGDECRRFGPPFVTSDDGAPGESIYFLSTNRGKRSVTIDFNKPEGQELVRELADKSDILVENYKVGGLAKMGLDYPSLSTRNPRLIYCSITGFGQTGPHRNRPGYDIVIQAMGGLMSVSGDPEGDPMKSGVAIADILTALYATTAILGALCERDTSGVGQHIDLALLDVQIASLVNHTANFLMTGNVPERYGNAHASIVPYQSFTTSDGRMIVAVANDPQFIRFAEIIGLPDLASDSRFKTNAVRVRNRKILLPLIAVPLRTKTTREWCGQFDLANIPAGPVNDVGEVFDDPQIEARNLVVEFPSGNHGLTRVTANPIRFSRTPVSYELPPPRLGEHTDEVLSNILNKSPEFIQVLRNNAVI